MSRVKVVREARIRQNSSATRIYPKGWTGLVDEETHAKLVKSGALEKPPKKARSRRAASTDDAPATGDEGGGDTGAAESVDDGVEGAGDAAADVDAPRA